jgi:demethylmenaquinone methyltransferase/2-methoxy-6-polyprenyl-1,4-benzoquinol methylase
VESTSHPAWSADDLQRNPHAAADKARRVREMFSAIAPSYDLNNRLHSFGRDQAWRRAAVKMAQVKPGETVLDAACGTGDLAMAFGAAGAARVIGVDFTYEMLTVAARKAADHADAANPRRGAAPMRPLSYHAGDAMRLPLADRSVDVVSIAFGIRNVAQPGQAFAEFHRVLRPGGRLIVLEFSLPRNPLLRGLYNFYFRHVMPRTATLIARDKSGAYRYLPRSVNTFINRDTLAGMMTDAGFESIAQKPVTFGIAVIYRGTKR